MAQRGGRLRISSNRRVTPTPSEGREARHFGGRYFVEGVEKVWNRLTNDNLLSQLLGTRYLYNPISSYIILVILNWLGWRFECWLSEVAKTSPHMAAWTGQASANHSGCLVATESEFKSIRNPAGGWWFLNIFDALGNNWCDLAEKFLKVSWKHGTKAQLKGSAL